MNSDDRSHMRRGNALAKYFSVTLSGFVASIVLMAAGSSQAASGSEGAQSPAVDATQFARGAKQWQLVCGSCHNLRSPSELSNAEWEVAMGQMRVRAGLTGAQARDITAFLKASNSNIAAPSQPALTAVPASMPASDPVSAHASLPVPTTASVPVSKPASVAASKPVSVAVSKPVAKPASVPASKPEKIDDATAAGSSKDSIAAGSAIYHQTCVACHGADGKGSIPGAPRFSDPNGVLGKSDAVLANSIENGKQTPGAPIPMPPKGGNSSLSTQDIRDVVIYLRSAFGKAK